MLGLGFLLASIACGEGEGTNPVGSEASGEPRRSLQTAAISVIDLGSLGGNSWAYAINEAGQAVGVSTTISAPPVTDQGSLGGYPATYGGYCCHEDEYVVVYPAVPSRAVLWQNGGITDLGTLGGMHSRALGINDLGQVVGAFDTEPIPDPNASGPYENAFLWEGGVMTDLGTLMHDPSDVGGYDYVLTSVGYDINNAGSVVGVYQAPLNYSNAFRYDGTPFHGGSINGVGDYSDAQAINELGQMVGGNWGSISFGLELHAYVADHGHQSISTILDPLPDFAGGLARSSATDINDIGQVVGGSEVGLPGTSHAVLWENGAIIELGTLGGNRSHATAINNKGQIVGWSTTVDNAEPHAFLWEGGVMIDLGTLGGSFSGARDINESGQIVGYSYLPGDAAVHATMWIIGPSVPPSPTTKAECKKGGWEAFGFRNQGQCVRLVETGKDSRNGQ